MKSCGTRTSVSLALTALSASLSVASGSAFTRVIALLVLPLDLGRT